MAFHYFAYGSNLWAPRLRTRCPSASFVTTGRLPGWSVAYRKPGADGTAKLDLVPAPGRAAHGAVYEIHDTDAAALDDDERGVLGRQSPVQGTDHRSPAMRLPVPS